MGNAASAAANREHDLVLAQRAAEGNPVAQRELFHKLKHGVHHTLFRILGANRDIEDLIQDAFLEIFRSSIATPTRTASRSRARPRAGSTPRSIVSMPSSASRSRSP